MKKWKILPIIMFLVLIPIGMTCKDRYDINEEVIILDIVESAGEGAQCNLSLYTSNLTLNQTNWMNRTGLSYKYNASKLTRDTYTAGIECNKSASIYLGECKFKVGEEVEMWDVTIGIIMIGLIGMFIYLAMKSKDIFKEPMINKAFMMFFFFIALGMSVVALQIGSEIVVDAGAPSGVASLMVTNYKVILWTLYAMMSIIFCIAVYYLFNYMRMSSGLFRSKRTGRH